jgi:hypothetical protein
VPADVPVATGTGLAEGAAATFARSNHVHTIGSGSINAAAMFAAGVVDAAAIATDAVGTAEIAANSVGSSELASNALDDMALFSSVIFEDTLTAANHFNNVTLGTGGEAYRWTFRFGDVVVVQCGFTLGTSGNVTGEVQLNLPYTAESSGPTGSGWLAGARCLDASTSNNFSGTALITNDALTIMKAAVLTGAAAFWDANTPMDWAVGDRFWAFSVYRRA